VDELFLLDSDDEDNHKDPVEKPSKRFSVNHAGSGERPLPTHGTAVDTGRGGVEVVTANRDKTGQDVIEDMHVTKGSTKPVGAEGGILGAIQADAREQLVKGGAEEISAEDVKIVLRQVEEMSPKTKKRRSIFQRMEKEPEETATTRVVRVESGRRNNNKHMTIGGDPKEATGFNMTAAEAVQAVRSGSTSSKDGQGASSPSSPKNSLSAADRQPSFGRAASGLPTSIAYSSSQKNPVNLALGGDASPSSLPQHNSQMSVRTQGSQAEQAARGTVGQVLHEETEQDLMEDENMAPQLCLDSSRRLNGIIMARSRRAELVIMNLPDIWNHRDPAECEKYMSYCEALVSGLDRVLFVHSCGHEVFDINS
jgi:hypothetical protein